MLIASLWAAAKFHELSVNNALNGSGFPLSLPMPAAKYIWSAQYWIDVIEPGPEQMEKVRM